VGTSRLTLTPSARLRFSLSGIPVLNYHGLASNGAPLRGKDARFWVSENSFFQHLRRIVACGCKALLAEDLLHASSSAANGGAAAAVTFDDGRACDYEIAFPMLVAAGLCATFFVNTATVDSPGHLTWSQLGEMRSAGMSVQSHSHDHTDLARLSSSQLDYQLRRSKAEIEDHLGSEVMLLALPYGSMGADTVTAARRVGYRALCSSGGGLARSGSAVLDRVCIYSDTTSGQISAILSKSPAFFGKKACRAALLGVPKQMVFSLFPGWVDSWRNRHE
jgi:peptidoglycan/xylan/chitin deacetylase (PgdA/CDA1 family)